MQQTTPFLYHGLHKISESDYMHPQTKNRMKAETTTGVLLIFITGTLNGMSSHHPTDFSHIGKSLGNFDGETTSH